MSIEIDWDSITSGDEGARLAESVRSFIHDRFQHISLPKLIRSVECHAFDFGTVPPDLEIKDVSDPLPDFYDQEDDDDHDDDDDDDDDEAAHGYEQPSSSDTPARADDGSYRRPLERISEQASANPQRTGAPLSPARTDTLEHSHTTVPSSLENPPPLFSRGTTPGIPGGTSNINNYFHLPLNAGLSGSATPFAAVAGGQGWPSGDHVHSSTMSGESRASFPRPVLTPHDYDQHRRRSTVPPNQGEATMKGAETPQPPPALANDAEAFANDVQIVAHLRYSGDIRMSLTADINLDYPMQSFVGIPLQLNVTGLTFDGVAVIAYIKHKAHFCFLAPEDAEALTGGSSGDAQSSVPNSPSADRQDATHAAGRSEPATKEVKHRIGGLFEEIKVESEIGRRSEGKQVLKNVGRVEKFVLEQVRNIFESEFVYPSFWTFLV